MSGTGKQRPPGGPDGSAGQGRLEATVQVLDFEPGFYSVEVRPTPRPPTRVRDGLSLPCIRLDPIAPANGQGGRAYVSALSEGSLILPGGHPAYLRAERGHASVMLTIYKVQGATDSPELLIRAIDPVMFAAPQPAAAPALPSLPLSLMAHVERSGDLTVPGGAWVGQPGTGTIEGFQLLPEGEIPAADIEYQAVLGKDWSTPWMNGGEFCGSRGLALPLLGVRMRLLNQAAKKFRCTYWGAFEGRGELGPFTDGAACAGDGGVLQALRVVIAARAAAPAPPGPTKSTPKTVATTQARANANRVKPPAAPKPSAPPSRAAVKKPVFPPPRGKPKTKGRR